MDIRALPLPARTEEAGPVDPLQGWSGDGLVVGLFQGEEDHPARALLSTLLGEGATAALERRRFRGKPGECLSFDRPGAGPGCLTLVGMGEPAR
jgi:leucyl aminopeptidase